MEKPAPVDHPVHDLVRRRWSPVAFAPDPVAPALLRTVLEAARWAPSSFNDQPWSFLVGIRPDPTWQGIHDALVEGNRAWAAGAPVLLLGVARERFRGRDRPNRHAAYDVGQAVAQMVLQALDLGLVAHQMAGYDAEAARARFAIPPGHAPMAAIALGRPGDAGGLSEALAARQHQPRRRRPLAAFTFAGRWGEAAPFLEGDAALAEGEGTA